MINYDSFEIHINNNIIGKILVEIDGKLAVISVNKIKDKEFLQKIKNIEDWLKIYYLGNYILNIHEYDDFKFFMDNVTYLIKPETVENTLLSRVKSITNK